MGNGPSSDWANLTSWRHRKGFPLQGPSRSEDGPLETRSPPLWRRASCHWAITGLLPIAIDPDLRRYRLGEIHLDRIDLPRILIPDVPGHPHRAEAGHEGIGIELLGRHDPDAAPATIGHQLGCDYRGNAGLVGRGLNSQFGVDLLVIGHIVDVKAAFLPVSDPARQRPDAGLAPHPSGEITGLGQQGYDDIAR